MSRASHAPTEDHVGHGADHDFAIMEQLHGASDGTTTSAQVLTVMPKLCTAAPGSPASVPDR